MSALIEAIDLRKYFPITRGVLRRKVGEVRAVDGVSFDVPEGATVALVGESGSGKTTLGKLVLRLLQPTAGAIRFAGEEITGLSEAALRRLRRQMQIVYQDPASALNPRRRVLEILEEPLIVHGEGDERQRRRRVAELLEMVEIPPDYAYRHPSALSGGQKQRVGIARALALSPKFILLDEPTSALDVSVQAKIIALLKKLQQDLGLTYLFITHNLSLVRAFASHTHVMYLGRFVESGPTERVFTRPAHPYTRALLSCIPAVSDEESGLIPEKVELPGEVPSAARIPSGCSFHPRCPRAMDVCRGNFPPPTALDGGHKVWCYLYD